MSEVSSPPFFESLTRGEAAVQDLTARFGSEFEDKILMNGDLAKSITHSAPKWEGWIVWTEVGSNKVYARRLEWGGIDSRGIRILPRPYFAPVVLREEEAISRILDEAVKS